MIHRLCLPMFFPVIALSVGAWSAAAEAQESFGIDRRVPWTTSRITGSPEPPPPYRLERVYPKLQFANPVIFTDAPGSDRMFLVELEGKIFSFTDDQNRETPDLFFDLGKNIDGMRRAYGLTFHPQFQQNGYCYICYVLADNDPEGTRVSRFHVIGDDPPRIDPASEKVLLTWRSGGHNGGCLKFGPDGFLYISTGDAGPAFPPDPLKSGQDVSNLRSSILRIDVDRPAGGQLYSVPSDNPFVELDEARPEVWAYGFRNPWKISFDPVNGALWVGDVGWEMWEMIYRVERGGNYGWSLVEGSQAVHRERTRGPTPVLPPTVEHSHIESRSITGGHVYRGGRLKDLVGTYVYGDYVTGKIWGVRHDGKQVTWRKELVDSTLQVICFGVDRRGELHVVGYDGTIHQLVPSPVTEANREFPTKLSETGLFASVKDHEVAPGVIPYSINAEPWADGAMAQRFVALPGVSKLGTYKKTNVQAGYIKGMWEFPTDGVLMKTISLATDAGDPASQRRIETQIFHFDVDTWRGYTYVWNDAQTDATLAPVEGEQRKIAIRDASQPSGQRTQTWRIAGRSECLLCHSTRGGSIYGFNLAQLNRTHDYGGRVSSAKVLPDQLRTLLHIGLFAEPLPAELPKMTSPADEEAALDDRARSYLHVNCAHCHRRGGGGTAAIELIRDFSIEKTHLLNARPTQGTFAIHGAEVLTPGDPFRSVLYYRMAKLGRGRMPYFGSQVVDQQGVDLIHDWIANWKDVPAPTASVAKLRLAQRAALRTLASERSPTDLRQQAADQLLSSTSGAMILLRAVGKQELSSPVRDAVLTKGTAHQDIQIRDLFERFLPEEKRTKRLGPSIDPGQILALRGDVEQGRKVFLSTAGVQCKNCHKIGDQGVAVGPELTAIGKKFDRAQLLESILQPSKQIDPKFLTYLVETSAGRVLSGLVVKRSDDLVILKNAQGKDVQIPADEIELIAPQQKSLMPELQLSDLTAEQVADLIAFLSSLK